MCYFLMKREKEEAQLDADCKKAIPSSISFSNYGMERVARFLS